MKDSYKDTVECVRYSRELAKEGKTTEEIHKLIVEKYEDKIWMETLKNISSDAIYAVKSKWPTP